MQNDPAKRLWRTTLLAILIGLALFLLARHSKTGGPAPAKAGAINSVAPDFSLTNLDGQKLKLSEYKGKIVLLDFWATWCAPCQEEIPGFVDMQKKYGDRGLQVIGISMDDSPAPVRPFYQKHEMNYPVAVGDAQLADRFGGVLGLPVTFLIDRDGKIRQKFVGATEVSTIDKAVQSLL